MLAIGWGNLLVVLKLYVRDLTVELHKIVTLEMENDLVALGWLAEQVVSGIDSFHRVQIVDPFGMKIVERKSIKDIALVFHTRFNKLKDKTVGIPRPAYHSTTSIVGNVMYILGLKGVISMRALTWKERIEALIEAGFWNEALDLGINYYNVRFIWFLVFI